MVNEEYIKECQFDWLMFKLWPPDYGKNHLLLIAISMEDTCFIFWYSRNLTVQNDEDYDMYGTCATWDSIKNILFWLFMFVKLFVHFVSVCLKPDRYDSI